MPIIENGAGGNHSRFLSPLTPAYALGITTSYGQSGGNSPLPGELIIISLLIQTLFWGLPSFLRALSDM